MSMAHTTLWQQAMRRYERKNGLIKAVFNPGRGSKPRVDVDKVKLMGRPECQRCGRPCDPDKIKDILHYLVCPDCQKGMCCASSSNPSRDLQPVT